MPKYINLQKKDSEVENPSETTPQITHLTILLLFINCMAEKTEEIYIYFCTANILKMFK